MAGNSKIYRSFCKHSRKTAARKDYRCPGLIKSFTIPPIICRFATGLKMRLPLPVFRQGHQGRNSIIRPAAGAPRHRCMKYCTRPVFFTHYHSPWYLEKFTDRAMAMTVMWFGIPLQPRTQLTLISYNLQSLVIRSYLWSKQVYSSWNKITWHEKEAFSNPGIDFAVLAVR